MKFRYLVIALIFLAALASDSWGQSKGRSQQMGIKQPETATSQPIPTEDQRGTEQSPLVVKVNPAPKTDAEREDESKERERVAKSDRQKEKSDADLVKYTSELAFFTKGLFYATIALFAATAGLGVAAFFQSRDTKASVAQAKRAADIAEASLVKLQRAFVTFRGLRYLSHIDSDEKVWWSLHFNWFNSGASPARRVRFFVSRYFEDLDLPDDFKFEVPIDRPTNFMGPNSTMQTGGLFVTADDLMAVRENKKFLYFWGRADYRDIFDGSTDHVTKFSMRVRDFRGDPAKVWDDENNVVEIILDNSPARHNCADEDCAQDA